MDPLKELVPEAFDVLVEQNGVAISEGAFSTKVKALMAVALSISTRCEPYLKVHVRRAREVGATPEEVAETIAVATLMEGGPAYVWSKHTMAELFTNEPTWTEPREPEGVLNQNG